MIWRSLYSQSSKDHGTLGYFKSLLNRITVKKDPKKAVDATLEFLRTVVTGHFLACACQLLGITELDSHVQLPPGILKSSSGQQQAYVRRLATQVVEQCTLVENAYTDEKVIDAGDHVYNYTRVLCHLGSLVLEFTDAWAEGDGERVYRCWRLFYPISKVRIVQSTRWKHCDSSFKSKQLCHPS